MHLTAAMVEAPWPCATYEDWLALLGAASAAGRTSLRSRFSTLTTDQLPSAIDMAVALAAVGHPAEAFEALDDLRPLVAGHLALEIDLAIAGARARFARQQTDAASAVEALKVLDGALLLLDGAELPAKESKVHGYRALAYRTQGKYREALEAFDAATALAAEMDPIDAAILWNNAGLTQLDLGLEEPAAESLQRALAIFKPLGETRYLASVAQNIGVIYTELGRLDEARRFTLRALDWWRELPGRILDQALTLINLGRICVNLNELNEAADYLSQAEGLIGQAASPGAEQLLRTNQGQLAEAQGDHATALGRYREALAIAESHQLSPRIWRTHLRLGGLLTTMGQREEGWGHLQAARAQFRDQQTTLHGAAERRGFLTQQRDLYGAILENRLPLDGGIVALSLAQEAKQAGWITGLVGDFPATSLPNAVNGLESLNALWTTGALTASTALIDYFVGHSAVYRFAYHPDSGLAATRLNATPAELAGHLARWQEQLHMLEQTPLDAQMTVAATFDQSPLRALSDALLDGLEASLGHYDTWYVCPHGILTGVPWNALVNAGGEPLLKQRALAQVPYFAHLLATNPLATTAGPQVLCTIGAGPDLPHARAEIQALLDLIRAGVGEVWPSADHATGCAEAIVAALPSLRLWHFAGHGKFDPADPAASYLACGDDRLTVAEFLEGRYQGPALQLVVLAACETAKLSAGAGSLVDGFIRALLATGARAILAGGWKVRDDATAQYMEHFYGALLSGATLPAAARTAVQGLWDAGFDSSHPYFWAGYQPWGAAALTLDDLARPAAHPDSGSMRRDRG